MKAIYMTPEISSAMIKQALAQIANKSFIENNKITLDFDSVSEKKKNAIKLNYTLEAWTKQKSLVDAFSSEIGWNGLVRKVGAQQYECYDIVVFPQSVTGGTVRTDQDKYQEWQDELSDEQFNNMRLNAHSHVNMTPTPSGQDLKDQQRLVDTLGADDFYFIFIWNKSEQYTVKFVDMATNAIYEGDEIEITIGGGTWRKDFVKEAKKMIYTPAPTAPIVVNGSGGTLIQKTATGTAAPKTLYNHSRRSYQYQGEDEEDELEDEWENEDGGYYDRYGTYITPQYNQGW